nr:MAG TPA: hypothetical protein [Caudoviricetes sp.]
MVKFFFLIHRIYIRLNIYPSTSIKRNIPRARVKVTFWLRFGYRLVQVWLCFGLRLVCVWFFNRNITS